MRHLKLVNPPQAGQQEPALRIAFASSDRHTVNQHFGAAEAFVIYTLHASGFQLAEVVEFQDRDIQQDGHEGKLEAKIHLLDQCAAVYCNAVGASAIRQLLATGIQPLKVDEGENLELLLKSLAENWHHQPPVWLQRALRQQQRPAATARFADMATQDWNEED